MFSMTSTMLDQYHRPRRRRRCDGFTLVEVLIVVVILAILATAVLPQLGTASNTARENTLKDDLRYLRTQIVVFKAQHRDVAPGYPNGDRTQAPTEAVFLDQMTTFTNETCGTSPTRTGTHTFGPYLSKMPSNPMTQLNAVLVIGNGQPKPAATGATYGWYYKPQTQEIWANCLGAPGTW
ncbi:MAG TPA: prepilin-type N-terminal cleavage/methylation domain-containing protein [Tepidisphaeraceae bacterium]|nr:prepilin-type N-terminal cleavage/methylation domain-containing protein [Tepidisphaeraceae bacterium]